jgi:hypothetical protein
MRFARDIKLTLEILHMKVSTKSGRRRDILISGILPASQVKSLIIPLVQIWLNVVQNVTKAYLFRDYLRKLLIVTILGV